MRIQRLWGLGLAIFVAVSCVTSRQVVVTLNRYEFQQMDDGVRYRIVLYALSPNAAQGAAAAAFQRIHQINLVLTDNGKDGELSGLAQSSGRDEEVRVTPDLWSVLDRAQKWAQQTHGAFDPVRLAGAQRASGYTMMELNPRRHTVKLLAPGMSLNLGEIAHGYVVAQAMVTLAHFGIAIALVSADGDMAVGGPPPGQHGWRIQLPTTANNPAAPEFILLTNAGLSASGRSDSRLVTVIAPDDFTAAGLAQAATVMAPEEALRFADKIPDAGIRIVGQTNRHKAKVYESSDFRKRRRRAS